MQLAGALAANILFWALVAVTGVWAAWRFSSRRWLRLLACMLLLPVAGLLFPPSNVWITRWWESTPAGFEDCTHEPKIIVLMPGGARWQPRGAGAAARLTGESLTRLARAVSLTRENQQAQLFIPGSPFEVHQFERYLLASSDLAPARLAFEPRAFDTDRAARLTAQRFGASAQPLWLVTSAAHLPRSIRAFEHYGLAVCPVASHYAGAVWRLSWFPSHREVARANILLHEWFGLLWYRLRYAVAASP